MHDCNGVTSDQQDGSNPKLKTLDQSPSDHFLVGATAQQLFEMGILPKPVYRDPPKDPAYLHDPPHFW